MVTALSAISQQIWDMKYRFKSAGGEPVDATLEESWTRVAGALAEPEAEPELWRPQFEEVMRQLEFLPAGRVIAGAGTARQVTLFNCFVMGTVPDSMDGIFTHLREAALTLQQGGGIGYDFSTLRPKGAPVHGVGADASGPLSFMDVWDSMCRTIMSAGSRRGAMMATLRCDHPDIERFIDAKRDPARLRMFNLSVLVTDAFMQAVREDSPWELRFDGISHGSVSARGLWDRIMRATYDYAEPGVIFIDRVNKANNLSYCETISATNPCGEQPLPPYGACLLGSVNLAQLVRDPFTPSARLDTSRLEDVSALAVRALDNVIDISRFPLARQQEEAKAKRRIGLGVTGLADALIMVGARYGSREAVALTEDWLRRLRDSAYAASVDLAREKGAFPLFDRDAFLAGETVSSLPEPLRAAIAEHGIRNALVTSIAPTGTISLLADNVSSGIEPVFSLSYRRAVLMPDGTRREEEVSDYAYRKFRRINGEDALLPEAFVDVASLTPHDHLVMQAAAQRFIDSAISKTINCPADLSFEAFKDVYRQAYDLGCKGCTTYRPNEVTGSVLSVDGGDEKAVQDPVGGEAVAGKSLAEGAAPPVEEVPVGAPGADVVYMTQPLGRPTVLPGQTYKLRWPDSDHALYITINDIEQEGRRRPFEVFINSKNMEHYAWTVALTRMISAVFRRGGDVSFVVEELKAVFDPRGGQWMAGRYVPSLLAAIGDVIEKHMTDIGFLSHEHAEIGGAARRVAASCPRCGSPGLTRQEGCDQCTSCGYSKCG